MGDDYEPEYPKLGPDLKRVLRVAHDEIISLRRRLTELEPKAHAYETIAQLARLTIQHEGGYAQEDIAWRIKDIVEKDSRDAEQGAG